MRKTYHNLSWILNILIINMKANCIILRPHFYGLLNNKVNEICYWNHLTNKWTKYICFVYFDRNFFDIDNCMRASYWADAKNMSFKNTISKTLHRYFEVVKSKRVISRWFKLNIFRQTFLCHRHSSNFQELIRFNTFKWVFIWKISRK